MKNFLIKHKNLIFFGIVAFLGFVFGWTKETWDLYRDNFWTGFLPW